MYIESKLFNSYSFEKKKKGRENEGRKKEANRLLPPSKYALSMHAEKWWEIVSQYEEPSPPETILCEPQSTKKLNELGWGSPKGKREKWSCSDGSYGEREKGSPPAETEHKGRVTVGGKDIQQEKTAQSEETTHMRNNGGHGVKARAKSCA